MGYAGPVLFAIDYRPIDFIRALNPSEILIEKNMFFIGKKVWQNWKEDFIWLCYLNYQSNIDRQVQISKWSMLMLCEWYKARESRTRLRIVDDLGRNRNPHIRQYIEHEKYDLPIELILRFVLQGTPLPHHLEENSTYSDMIRVIHAWYINDVTMLQ